uniref:Uncharacterized protein n=1 Tax=Eutreptiella gymnastica TaxID=73025 RepID=A0A7S1NAE1_9EUGL
MLTQPSGLRQLGVSQDGLGVGCGGSGLQWAGKAVLLEKGQSDALTPTPRGITGRRGYHGKKHAQKRPFKTDFPPSLRRLFPCQTLPGVLSAVANPLAVSSECQARSQKGLWMSSFLVG